MLIIKTNMAGAGQTKQISSTCRDFVADYSVDSLTAGKKT